MAGQDVRQLLLQVDASVALAQRNLGALASQVDQDTRRMEGNLGRPEIAIANLERAFGSMNQVMIASANQQRALGSALDRVTAAELQAAQAVAGFARGISTVNAPLQAATRQQLEAAAAIAGFARAASGAGGPLEELRGKSGGARIAQMELMHVVRSSADSYAAGQHASTIFAMEVGRIAEAASFAGGSLGRFGAVMAGPWGIAITAGVSLLAIFIPKLLELGQGVDSLVEKKRRDALQSDLNAQADTIWRHSIEGLTATINEQNHALAQRLQLQSQVRDATLSEQRTNQAEKAEQRRVLLGQVAGAGAQVRDLEQRVATPSVRSDPRLLGSLTGELSEARERFADLTRQLNAANTALLNAGDAVRRAETEQARALSTSEGLITRRFDREQGRLEESYLNHQISYDQLQAGEDNLTARRVAAQRAASEAAAAERHLGEARAMTVAEASAIARGAGATVTSGFRTRATQARLYADYMAGRGPLAARPGTSAHERGAAIDLVGISLSQARAAFAGRVAPGRIIEELNPRTGGRHIHVPLAGHGAEREADSAARRQEAAQLRATRQEDDFQEELQRANDRVIAARQELNQSTEQQADFAAMQVRAEGDRLNLALRSKVNEGRMTAAQAERLRTLNNAATEERIATIRERERRELADQAVNIQIAGLRSQEQLLQGQERLVTSARDRLAIENRIIDLQEQEERLQLQKVLAFGSGASADQWNEAFIRFQALPQDYAQRRQSAANDNEGPAARRLRELRSEVGDLSTAYENLGVNAMRSLEDATVDTVKATLHLHGVLGDIVADLIRIGLQRSEMGFLDAITGGAKGGGGGGGLGGLFSSLFGGGSGGGAGGFDFLGAASKMAPGAFATGGSIFVGGRSGVDRNLLSLNGHPVARVSQGERIDVVPQVPRAPVVRIPQAANQNGTVHVAVSLDSGMLQAKIVRTSAGVTAAMAPATAARGAGMALKKASRSASRRIPTGM